tara:strand:+ start:42 stop:965 length:924 start_codon:yes stop_codon:yes gene_type:complete
MKVLITGATGLIGTALVKKAISEGIKIHYLTTKKSKINSIKGAAGFYWNPSLNIIDNNCFKGVQSIIHLAGSSISKPWTSNYKRIILSSRIDSTRLLISSIKKLKPHCSIKNIVSASAIGIYPSQFGEIQTEKTHVSPNSFMEQVVISWEKELEGFNKLNIKVSKLRIGLVLSFSGGILKTLKIPTLFGLGTAFGNGKQGQSWIHIDDLVEIFIKSTKETWEGVYNAAAPNPVSQKYFLKALAKALNRPYFLPPIPKFLLKLLIGEMSSLILDSHWVSSQRLIEKGFNFSFKDIDMAMQEIIDKSKS